MPGAKWFEDTRLNFAENLLARDDDHVALVFGNERGAAARAQLPRAARRGGSRRRGPARARHRAGRPRGGIPAEPARVGRSPCWRPPASARRGPPARPTSASTACSTASARWRRACCSPPTAISTTARRSIRSRRCAACSSSCRPWNASWSCPTCADRPDLAGVPQAVHFARVRPRQAPALEFTRVPFDTPLFVMYSSGTTGVPKCIVHGVGGTLLQHRKEHLLHCDLKPDDRLFFFTTCGWMMWNWLVSGLATGCTLVLYDGSPFAPDRDVLWRLAERERVTHFGTSPKYLSALQKDGGAPGRQFDLARAARAALDRLAARARAVRLRLRARSRRDLHLASISGGTDIISCFCLGNPWLPVHRGEIQSPGLGMATEVYDERRPRGARAAGRAGLHGALPVDADRLLERSRTARSTAPPTSSASRAPGATATTRCTPRTAASSSSAAPTRC